MKNWSIRNRVLIVALAPAVCIAIFLSAYFSSVRLVNVERVELEKARAIATHLAPTSEFAVVSDNRELLENLSLSVLRDDNITRVRITDDAGGLLSIAGRGPAAAPQGWLEDLRALVSETPILSTVRAPIYRTTVDTVWEFTDYPPTAEPELLGWVEIELDLSNALRMELNSLGKSALLTLFALLATALLAVVISATVSRPIASLTATVDLLRQGYLDQRANTYSGAELGRLEMGINEMAATIQASQQRLEEEVAKATGDLTTALAELEERNQELEEARMAAQQASDFKSQFLANMSHEIRTPINVILGFSELLSHSSHEPLHRDYLETIRGSAQSLLSLLNDILDLSRVESGQLSLENTSIDLNGVLNDVHSLFAPGAYERGIEFHVARTDDEVARVKTDPLRIRQVLINLVNNAVKFTSKGHVLVTAEVTQQTREQRWIRFTVEDTGTGIPRRAQPTLFQAFSQGDMTTSRNYGGSGLGLHIASEIVLLMNGDIAFESELGEGSTFWVTLPFESAGTPDEVAPGEPAPLPAVVVEDYPPFTSHYRRFFEQAGIGICAPAPDAERVVIVNLSASALRTAALPQPPPHAAAPEQPRIAYCSSYDPDVVQGLRDLGFHGVVVKTSSPRKFRTELDRALGTLSPESQPASEPAPVPRDDLRLLVIDDHPINLKLVQSYARHLGIDIQCLASPVQALELATRVPYDLIFMDLHMPDLDGRELTQRLRAEDSANRTTPIVALTADAYQREADLVAQGMSALLVKPVSLAAFESAVARWGGRPSRPAAATAANLAAELREALVKRLPEDRAALRAAAREREPEELRLQAHKLHGAAVYCDTPALARAAKRLEQTCRTGDSAAVASALAELLEAIDRLLATATAP